MLQSREQLTPGRAAESESQREVFSGEDEATLTLDPQALALHSLAQVRELYTAKPPDGPASGLVIDLTKFPDHATDALTDAQHRVFDNIADAYNVALSRQIKDGKSLALPIDLPYRLADNVRAVSESTGLNHREGIETERLTQQLAKYYSPEKAGELLDRSAWQRILNAQATPEHREIIDAFLTTSRLRKTIKNFISNPEGRLEAFAESASRMMTNKEEYIESISKRHPNISFNEVLSDERLLSVSFETPANPEETLEETVGVFEAAKREFSSMPEPMIWRAAFKFKNSGSYERTGAPLLRKKAELFRQTRQPDDISTDGLWWLIDQSNGDPRRLEELMSWHRKKAVADRRTQYKDIYETLPATDKELHDELTHMKEWGVDIARETILAYANRPEVVKGLTQELSRIRQSATKFGHALGDALGDIELGDAVASGLMRRTSELVYKIATEKESTGDVEALPMLNAVISRLSHFMNSSDRVVPLEGEGISWKTEDGEVTITIRQGERIGFTVNLPPEAMEYLVTRGIETPEKNRLADRKVSVRIDLDGDAEQQRLTLDIGSNADKLGPSAPFIGALVSGAVSRGHQAVEKLRHNTIQSRGRTPYRLRKGTVGAHHTNEYFFSPRFQESRYAKQVTAKAANLMQSRLVSPPDTDRFGQVFSNPIPENIK